MGFIQILYKLYIDALSNLVFKFLVQRLSLNWLFLGIHIILDLTPNYQGQNAWFLPAQADVVAAKVKVRVWLAAYRDWGCADVFTPALFTRGSCAWSVVLPIVGRTGPGEQCFFLSLF